MGDMYALDIHSLRDSTVATVVGCCFFFWLQQQALALKIKTDQEHQP